MHHPMYYSTRHRSERTPALPCRCGRGKPATVGDAATTGDKNKRKGEKPGCADLQLGGSTSFRIPKCNGNLSTLIGFLSLGWVPRRRWSWLPLCFFWEQTRRKWEAGPGLSSWPAEPVNHTWPVRRGRLAASEWLRSRMSAPLPLLAPRPALLAQWTTRLIQSRVVQRSSAQPYKCCPPSRLPRSPCVAGRSHLTFRCFPSVPAANSTLFFGVLPFSRHFPCALERKPAASVA